MSDSKALNNGITTAILNATDGFKEQTPLVCGFRDAATGVGTLVKADPLPNGGYKWEGVRVDETAPAQRAQIEAGMQATNRPSFCVPR